MKNRILICAAIVIYFSSCTFAGTWTTLDKPGVGVSGTEALGISGKYIVGIYYDSHFSGEHGFLYDSTNWITLDAPGAQRTWVEDNYSNYVIGTYDVGSSKYSFLNYGTSWTTLSKPGLTSIKAKGIHENQIVGNCVVSGKTVGFISDGINWTTIDKPGATSTYFKGISGNDIVGEYYDAANQHHSFLYNQGTWTDIPNNPWAPNAEVIDISGNYIVATYLTLQVGFGLLYDGTNWTKLEMLGASFSIVSGIDGDKVVGSYTLPSSSGTHGFIYTIPEPATLLLFGIGVAVIRKRR